MIRKAFLGMTLVTACKALETQVGRIPDQSELRSLLPPAERDKAGISVDTNTLTLKLPYFAEGDRDDESPRLNLAGWGRCEMGRVTLSFSSP